MFVVLMIPPVQLVPDFKAVIVRRPLPSVTFDAL